MKIAIFHNFLDNIGGAEILSLTLARDLKADFYSTNIDKEKVRKMGFTDINLISIGQVPANAPFRQQFTLWKFKKLDFKKKYDFYIISGDWAVSGVLKNKPNLWYVHSPIREIWDLYKYTRQNNVPWFGRWAFDFWVKYNRYLNQKYARQADLVACNSTNTQKRIKKYLNREAVVINPPIETEKFYYQKNGDYWLSVNRLINHKRVEIQTQAFRQLPDEKLIIVGSYEKSIHFKNYADQIQRNKPRNVKIISWLDNKELIKLYANCRGFIATAKDEDFGMAVVEAMASGKPVIAPNEGGYRETIINNVTGKLIDNIDADKLVKAIKEIRINPQQFKDNCLAQAQKFNSKIFIEKIKKQIKNY